MIGRILDHYRIVEQIGAGGMGVVYRAHDERLERDVALKVLPSGALSDEAARKRFRKEALALSRLNHPNIATVYDFDTQEGVDFLVLEYIPGTTLSEKLSGGGLPEKEVLRLGVQLAQGLEAAHREGVVHRDLKPGNLRVTPDGRLKILDFGLATLRHPAGQEASTVSLAQTAKVAGTLPYMAPEQLRGEPVDARSDLYAAGAVLYEMAAGRRAFADSHGAELVAAILQRTPAPPATVNRTITPALENIILKALDKDAERRYQSARELAVDLERLSVPTTALQARKARPRRWPWAAAAAVAVLAALVLGLDLRGRRPGRVESLAVLPLKNLTGDPAQEYFVDGMTEALITDLAQIRALRVISQTSIMQYKDAKKPLPEIARALNVEAIVEGSVLRAGSRVRITAQLIEARSDRHLWANSYERDLGDVLALQREVARAIAGEIRIQVTPQEQARLASGRAVHPKAYETYLQGRFHALKFTESEIRKALEYYQQAIAEDPTYAPAYSGLADAYNLLGMIGVAAPREVWPRAKEAARKARDLDDALSEAHVSLANVHAFHDRQWQEAEREIRRAIELNPGRADGHHWYGHYLEIAGRLDQALAEMRRARELDPLSFLMNWEVARALYYARRYDESIEQYGKTLELDPLVFRVHGNIGWPYVAKGMFQEAVAAFEKARASSEGNPENIFALAYTYAAWGKGPEARKVLADLSRRPYVPPTFEARVLVLLGEKDRAFELLRRADTERDFDLNWLKVDPTFDPLRSDPRFQDLLRRMGLPP